MQRLWNELTATRKRKANYGYGGVKVGDFGTGGRVYSSDYAVPRGQGSGGCTPQTFGISSCLCTLLPLLALIVTERTLFLSAGCIEEASEQAVRCDSPYSVSENEGSLIFVTTDPEYPPQLKGEPPTDIFFNYPVPATHGIARRVTEYCQWAEMRHSQRKKTGRTNQKGEDIYTQEVWYTYHKSWRSQQINSLFFDNPAAYHNPTRDPAPSKTLLSARGIDLSGKASSLAGLSISSQDMSPAMQPWQRLPITKEHTTNGVSQQALKAGFSEADHVHYYSRKPKNGWNNPLFQAGVSYLVDGILDINSMSQATGIESLLNGAGLGWITKGTCDSGDVRVHFEAKRLPQSVSLVGQQLHGAVVPMLYSNGQSKLLLRSGYMTLEKLLHLSLSDLKFWQNWYRVGIFVLVLLGGVLFENYSNFHDADWKLGVGLGGCLFSGVFLLLSLYFYGLDDSYVSMGGFVVAVSCLVVLVVGGGGGGGGSGSSRSGSKKKM